MKFFTEQEESQIMAAIEEAERKTSGEIRVHLAKRCRGSPVKTAARVFERLGMTKTAERNGILFYLAPKDRKFSVIGDIGIHEKMPPDFWDKVRDATQENFRKGGFAKGIVDGINVCGGQLARHFPRKSDDRSELPDEISTA